MIITDLNYAELIAADVNGAGYVHISAGGDIAVGEGSAKTSKSGSFSEHGTYTTYTNKDSAKGGVKVVNGNFDITIASGLH
jgi:hypothetical protein